MNFKSIIKYTVVLLAVVCLANVNANAQQKIGYTNSQVLFSEMSETKAAQSQLKDYSEQLNKQYDAKEKALQQKLESIRKEAVNLTPNQIKVKEEELQKEAMELENTRRGFETDIVKKEQELMRPLTEKFAKAIESVAKENGYSFIIDSSALLHGMDANDVTSLIKTKLGM